MNEDRKWLFHCAGRLNEEFQNVELLETALTHRSFANEAGGGAEIAHNEQLEFLGDAVLQLVVSEWLFRRRRHQSEGVLTRLRAALVCEKSLAEAARRISLGEMLRLGRGEEATGGRDKDSVLSDAFEAVCAAIYLDGGLERAGRFIRHTLSPALERLEDDELDFDPKSQLQQLMQQRGGALPAYRVVRQEGPDHHRLFRVEVSCSGGELRAEGQGPSKKAAEQAAARAALDLLHAGK